MSFLCVVWETWSIYGAPRVNSRLLSPFFHSTADASLTLNHCHSFTIFFAWRVVVNTGRYLLSSLSYQDTARFIDHYPRVLSVTLLPSHPIFRFARIAVPSRLLPVVFKMKAHFMSLCAVIVLSVQAHYFDIPSSRPDDMSLSDFCDYASNAVQMVCSDLLAKIVVNKPRLNSDQLSQFCTSGCRSAMINAQAVIAAGCGNDRGPFIFNGSVWPSTKDCF